MERSSVKGLDEFRRHMQGMEGSYVIIGGTACDILLTESDLDFRATHDLDTVLVADTMLPKTARAIWSLVRDGGYRCGWGDKWLPWRHIQSVFCPQSIMGLTRPHGAVCPS